MIAAKKHCQEFMNPLMHLRCPGYTKDMAELFPPLMDVLSRERKVLPVVVYVTKTAGERNNRLYSTVRRTRTGNQSRT